MRNVAQSVGVIGGGFVDFAESFVDFAGVSVVFAGNFVGFAGSFVGFARGFVNCAGSFVGFARGFVDFAGNYGDKEGEELEGFKGLFVALKGTWGTRETNTRGDLRLYGHSAVAPTQSIRTGRLKISNNQRAMRWRLL
ncbi:MAG: hypothetical protein LBJ67_07510 [Planctomycetaceae bacterium]|nr:hypothetical protein [Planctomycetaceae bacterium]